MNGEKSNIYNITEINNLKELTNDFGTKYKNNIAFKYKKATNTKETESNYVSITYNEFSSNINSLGTKLINMGLKNKKIAIISPNRYEWCVSYFAVVNGTGIVVPLDKSLPDNEIESSIIRSKVEAVIFDKSYSDIFTKIKNDGKSSLEFYISMDSDINLEFALNFKDLVNDGNKLIDNGNKEYTDAEIDNEKMSIMLFTSGTTSMSKIVMLSHKNIASNINSICRSLLIYPDDVMLSFLPLHHTFECSTTFLTGLHYGACIAFCDGVKHIAKNMAEYKVSVFIVVPILLESMYKKVMKGIADSGKAKLVTSMSNLANFLLKFKIDVRKKVFSSVLNKLGGRLRLIVSGAAALDKDTLIGFRNFGVTVFQGYGLTETSPVLAVENVNYMKAGSIGMPLYNVELEIDNPGENGIGEIKAKGPNVMLGYYENKEETDNVLKDGWFYTGDLGYIDDEGYTFITGRKKNVIVLKNGKNIFPEELEALANNIPGVLESIVYGKHDKDDDLLICIKIVYSEETMKELYHDKEISEYKSILTNEIKKINKNMPAYKYIRDIIVTNEPLIKTTTQKIKRHEEIAKILG